MEMEQGNESVRRNSRTAERGEGVTSKISAVVILVAFAALVWAAYDVVSQTNSVGRGSVSERKIAQNP